MKTLCICVTIILSMFIITMSFRSIYLRSHEDPIAQRIRVIRGGDGHLDKEEIELIKELFSDTTNIKE